MNVLHFSTSAVLDFKSFFVTIEDCANVWKPAVNLTTIDYRLESSNTVIVPEFIDLSLVKCNPVTIQFQEVSGVDLTNVIQLKLTDEYLGTAELAIYTDSASFRGSYII